MPTIYVSPAECLDFINRGPGKLKGAVARVFELRHNTLLWKIKTHDAYDTVSLNFNVQNLANPATSRPVDNRAQGPAWQNWRTGPWSDTLRNVVYNPKTGCTYIRKCPVRRGASDPTKQYTKKAACSLVSTGGRQPFYNAINTNYSEVVGLLFNTAMLDLKEEKYFFPFNAMTNSKWWLPQLMKYVIGSFTLVGSMGGFDPRLHGSNISACGRPRSVGLNQLIRILNDRNANDLPTDTRVSRFNEILCGLCKEALLGVFFQTKRDPSSNLTLPRSVLSFKNYLHKIKRALYTILVIFQKLDILLPLIALQSHKSRYAIPTNVSLIEQTLILINLKKSDKAFTDWFTCNKKSPFCLIAALSNRDKTALLVSELKQSAVKSFLSKSLPDEEQDNLFYALVFPDGIIAHHIDLNTTGHKVHLAIQAGFPESEYDKDFLLRFMLAFPHFKHKSHPLLLNIENNTPKWLNNIIIHHLQQADVSWLGDLVKHAEDCPLKNQFLTQVVVKAVSEYLNNIPLDLALVRKLASQCNVFNQWLDPKKIFELLERDPSQLNYLSNTEITHLLNTATDDDLHKMKIAIEGVLNAPNICLYKLLMRLNEAIKGAKISEDKKIAFITEMLLHSAVSVASFGSKKWKIIESTGMLHDPKFLDRLINTRNFMSEAVFWYQLFEKNITTKARDCLRVLFKFSSKKQSTSCPAFNEFILRRAIALILLNSPEDIMCEIEEVRQICVRDATAFFALLRDEIRKASPSTVLTPRRLSIFFNWLSLSDKNTFPAAERFLEDVRVSDPRRYIRNFLVLKELTCFPTIVNIILYFGYNAHETRELLGKVLGRPIPPPSEYDIIRLIDALPDEPVEKDPFFNRFFSVCFLYTTCVNKGSNIFFDVVNCLCKVKPKWMQTLLDNPSLVLNILDVDCWGASYIQNNLASFMSLTVAMLNAVTVRSDTDDFSEQKLDILAALIGMMEKILEFSRQLDRPTVLKGLKQAQATFLFYSKTKFYTFDSPFKKYHEIICQIGFSKRFEVGNYICELEYIGQYAPNVLDPLLMLLLRNVTSKNMLRPLAGWGDRPAQIDLEPPLASDLEPPLARIGIN